MLSKQEEIELTKELGSFRRKVVELRRDLNLVNNEKEAAFGDKDKCGNEIKELEKRADVLKSERDSLISQIKEDKAKRQELNSEFREKVTKLKEVKEPKNALIKKYGIKNPLRIKETIEALEYKIETEVLPFEKEKQLVKKIKELKKKAEEAKVISEMDEEIKWISEWLNSLRTSSDFVHHKIQSRAIIAQKKHEEFISLLKTMDELRIKRLEWLQKSLKLKEKFNSINELLKENLTKMNELNKKFMEHSRDKKKIRENIIREKLRGKEEIVQEKIRKGEKLTTEDILVMQELDKDNSLEEKRVA